MAWLMMVQAVSGPVLPPPAVTPQSFTATSKPSADPGDITVCARTDEPYRLRKLPAGFEKERPLPKAETSLLGGKMAVETEQVEIGGVPSRRAMIRFKLPF